MLDVSVKSGAMSVGYGAVVVTCRDVCREWYCVCIISCVGKVVCGGRVICFRVKVACCVYIGGL